MAKKIHELPQTKGAFLVRGLASELKKESAFEEKQTKNGGMARKAQFAVSVSNNIKLFFELFEILKESAYFYNPKTKTTIKVPYADRYKKQEKDYELIGTLVGLESVQDENGDYKYKKQKLHNYDATKYIYEHVKDNMNLEVRGSVDFSSFETNDCVKKIIKLIPKNISINDKKIDFDAEDFQSTNSFNQIIVYTGIKEDEDNKGIFLVSGYIVNYSSIERVEFILKNANLAKRIKKEIAPYTSMKVIGRLVKEVIVEEAEVDDGWGETDQINTVKHFSPMQLIMTGIKDGSFDTETYTEEKIQNALRAIKEFGNNYVKKEEKEDDDDWGEELDKMMKNDIPF